MKKRLLCLMLPIILLMGSRITGTAATTLSKGDIAFIGLYMDGNATSGDGFTFILLKSVDAGTVIYFTDEGWDDSSNHTWYGNSNDAHLTWTAPTGGSSIGTIVYIVNTAANTFSTTSGTVSYANGTWNLSSGGDQILAYQSSTGARPASPTFIAAADADYYNTYDGMNGWTTSYDLNTINYACYLPPGLTNGTNCVALVNGTTAVAGGYAVGYECDNYKYTGTLTGSVDAIRTAINTTSNWTGNEDGTMSISSGYSAVNISTDNPEINITGNGVTIADEDATPSTSDYTDFGSTPIDGGTVIRSFTIQNTGAGLLTLTGSSPYITIGGTNSGDFSVTAIPSPSIAATTGTTTFSITFNPSGSGTRSATLSIANNDADENPYNFSIQGVGTAPEPEMSISGNSVEIADGDATPSTSDHTDYGYADINTGSLTYTYTITNQGLATLTLSGSPIVTSSSSDFTVTQPSVSSIAASGSTTFQVTFNPTATGTRTASISIANNDSNENPYNFTVQGYGTSQNLVAGDIAFIGYNSDDPDGFTFIALNDIPATEMIYFTEEGWNSTAWAGSSVETHYAWQAPAGGLAIGTIVYIYETGSVPNVLAASAGTISGVLSGSTFHFSSGDQVLAYQSGSGVKPTSPTFIAGLHADYFSTNYNSTTTWSQSASAGEENASTVPAGLTNGQNCVSLFPATTEYNNSKYTGTLTGTSDAIRLAINTYTNWSSSDTRYDISSASYTPSPSITYSSEMNIQGNSTTIADGDASPSLADYTDFGTANVTTGTVSRTFTIQNTGKASLTLSGTPKVAVSGTNSSDFTVTTQPTSPVAATSGTTTFTVQFVPSGTGTRTATLSITNNDANENPYDFSIQGTGLIAPTVTTQAVSNIGTTNVIGNGNISNLGNPNPTAYGICYGTTANPDITGNKADKGAASVTGAFTAQLTGLTPGTTYHARAFATNSAETAYGTDVSFTTTATMTEPGNALNFDGTNDYVVAADNDNGLTAFTIEAWVKWSPTTTSDVNFICGKAYEQMEIHTGGGAGANGVRFIPTTGVWLDAANVLPTGVWTHVAVVYKPSTSTAKMYINGQEVSLNTTAGTIGTTLQSTATPFYIGCRSGATPLYFKGSIDEVRVWNLVRSQAQIQADMDNAISASSSGLINYYNFNEGTTGSTMLPDLTSNGNNGTLTNFALTGATSNWVESYAMVAPIATAATSVSVSGFTVNWTAPTTGTVNNYLLDVATDAAFTSLVSGYNPKTIAAPSTSSSVTGLSSHTQYYYRLRADKTSITGQGAYSNAISTTTLFPASSTFNTTGNWSTAGNWSNGLPGSATEATISANCTVDGNFATGNLILKATGALTIPAGNTLTVNGELDLESDDHGTASLINNGTLSATGTIKARRYMTGGKWHIVSPTVAEGSISTFIQAPGNAISSKDVGGTLNYGMMDYNETTNTWKNYFTSGTGGNLIAGTGYSVRRNTDGDCRFYRHGCGYAYQRN